MTWFALIYILPFAAVSALLFLVTFSMLQERRAVLNTPTTAMAEVTTGHTEVQGLVSDLSTTVESPIEQVPCVWWRLDVQRKPPGKNSWEIIHRATGHGTCLLSDDTGAIELTLGHDAVRPIEAEAKPIEGLDEELRAFCNQEGLSPPAEMVLRGIEYRLEVGHPVYAIGQASQREGEFPLLGGTPESEFIIAQGTEADMLATNTSGLWFAAISAVVTGGIAVFATWAILRS